VFTGEREKAREREKKKWPARVLRRRRGACRQARAAALVLADGSEAVHRVVSAAPPCCFSGWRKTMKGYGRLGPQLGCAR
jgi:hypothetical protein